MSPVTVPAGSIQDRKNEIHNLQHEHAIRMSRAEGVTAVANAIADIHQLFSTFGECYKSILDPSDKEIDPNENVKWNSMAQLSFRSSIADAEELLATIDPSLREILEPIVENAKETSAVLSAIAETQEK